MCGIVGIASRDPLRDPQLLERMRDEITHRGPDDAGAWFSKDCRVALGLRRLAIIDLSPAGHQPMMDADGRACIAYNGEIYNYRILRGELEGLGHRFRTASDTEVILEAYKEWGTDCLRKLNGMFALALFDLSTRKLFLARDRAGEKPLFYRHAGGKLVFASELKALMVDAEFPRKLDAESFNFYLAYGYVPGGRCILEGVHKLPQGNALLLDLDSDRLDRWTYWKLPEATRVREDPEDLVEELEELLLDSVRLRLIADVPVGIMLSGGLDSSLVTAMASRVASDPVRTFTISFPGHGVDEGPFARTVAEHFGTRHTELVAEPATVDLLPKLARQYDEPIADSSMVPTYLVSRLIRQHATVALGGDGGDELFGGYFHYDWLERQRRVQRLVPSPLRRLIGKTAEALVPVGTRGRNYLIGFSGELSRLVAHVNIYFDVESRRRLLAPGAVAASGGPENYRAALCPSGQTPLYQATAVDFETYLVDDILVKVDRASMLTSLEVRAPWLDPRIIELAFGRVPDSLRAVNGKRKILPRRLAERLLPASLDLRRKQGFALPLAQWFRGDWGRFVEEVLAEAGGEIFEPRMVRRLIAGQRRGLANTHRLFALTMFELWRRQYRVSL